MTLAVTDERKEVHGSDNFPKLESMLREYLPGKPVLRVTVGDELVFHLGDPQTYQTAKMKGHARGSWQLRVLRSPWLIHPINGEGVVFGTGIHRIFGEHVAEEFVEAKCQELFRGARVEDLKIVETVDLLVSFSNGYMLSLFGRYAKSDPTKVLWKVTTPYKMAIHVFGHPADCWSYLRSDVPLREG